MNNPEYCVNHILPPAKKSNSSDSILCEKERDKVDKEKEIDDCVKASAMAGMQRGQNEEDEVRVEMEYHKISSKKRHRNKYF